MMRSMRGTPRKRARRACRRSSRVSQAVPSGTLRRAEVDAMDLSNTGSEGPQTQQPSFSCGSLGHPGACRGPCKYASKSRGCKDGENCTRCHMCRWSRTGETKKKKKEASAIGSPVAGGSAEVCARIPLRMAELLENDRSLFDTKFG
mmetsp:Transcript_33552/g.95033  ORF Transcript_33552/g.95033 Transcript_33552/m.95033 type:complete len:147 (-) Transcript_33552:78-518(-)